MGEVIKARKLECVIQEIGLKVLYYNYLRSDTRGLWIITQYTCGFQFFLPKIPTLAEFWCKAIMMEKNILSEMVKIDKFINCKIIGEDENF